jgi:hypothetical protein
MNADGRSLGSQRREICDLRHIGGESDAWDLDGAPGMAASAARHGARALAGGGPAYA